MIPSLKKFKKYFGNLTVTRGKRHDFLGMNIVIRYNHKKELEIKDQILEAIDAVGEDVSVSSPNLAGKNLNKQ